MLIAVVSVISGVNERRQEVIPQFARLMEPGSGDCPGMFVTYYCSFSDYAAFILLGIVECRTLLCAGLDTGKA
jgi:hypothetical protein